MTKQATIVAGIGVIIAAGIITASVSLPRDNQTGTIVPNTPPPPPSSSTGCIPVRKSDVDIAASSAPGGFTIYITAGGYTFAELPKSFASLPEQFVLCPSRGPREVEGWEITHRVDWLLYND